MTDCLRHRAGGGVHRRRRARRAGRSPAVKGGGFPQALVIALLVVAPLAGLLHWLESWLAHDMAYRLLAEMRIDLFAKLEALAPAYLLERRSGDLVALATQDVETVEYFFAHTVAPAFVAVLVPCAVLAWLAASAWPLALALAPFLAYAGSSPFLRRRHVDALATRSRAALGRARARTSPRPSRACPSCSPSAPAAVGVRHSWRSRGATRTCGLHLLDDLARQSEHLELATGLGGLAIAVLGAQLAAGGGIDPALVPLFILISVAAFLPVSEIAQVSRQLADTIASTRRLASRRVRAGSNHRRHAGRSGGARRNGRALRACPVHLSGAEQGGAVGRELRGARPERPSRWSVHPAPARPPSRTCCCVSGIPAPARSGWTASSCRGSRSMGCASASPWSRRTPIFSTTRWRPTSCSRARRHRARPCSGP